MDRGYGPQGHKESDTTEATQFTPTRTQTRAHCLLLKHTDREGHAMLPNLSDSIKYQARFGSANPACHRYAPSPFTHLWVPFLEGCDNLPSVYF